MRDNNKRSPSTHVFRTKYAFPCLTTYTYIEQLTLGWKYLKEKIVQINHNPFQNSITHRAADISNQF